MRVEVILSFPASVTIREDEGIGVHMVIALPLDFVIKAQGIKPIITSGFSMESPIRKYSRIGGLIGIGGGM